MIIRERGGVKRGARSGFKNKFILMTRLEPVNVLRADRRSRRGAAAYGHPFDPLIIVWKDDYKSNECKHDQQKERDTRGYDKRGVYDLQHVL